MQIRVVLKGFGPFLQSQGYLAPLGEEEPSVQVAHSVARIELDGCFVVLDRLRRIAGILMGEAQTEVRFRILRL